MKSVGKFLAITLALSWTFWLLASTAPSGTGIQRVLFLPGTFAPALVAFWLTSSRGGKAKGRALLRRALAARVGLRWYVFAAGYMAGIKLAAAALHRIVSGVWPSFGKIFPGVLLAAVVVSTPFQAGEELGWRGFALPRMALAIGVRRSSIVLGVIWATWHLPLFFISGGDMIGQSFPMYVLDVTALSVAFTWLYVNTRGSVLLVMILHSAVNNTTGIVPAGLPGTDGATSVFALHGSLMGWLTGLLLWVAAAYFLIRMPQFQAAAHDDQVDAVRSLTGTGADVRVR